MHILLLHAQEPSRSMSVTAPHVQIEKSSQPVQIRIPDIAVNASFEEPLSLTSDGAIEVPKQFETVGWYKHGPTPGETGPSVVLGHVDSFEGPAVFWDLKKLREGDEILIDREDGTTVAFVVTKVEHRTQGSFPTEDVYGDIDHAGLRLITCSGFFNHDTLRYSHNLIVYAVLASTTEQ